MTRMTWTDVKGFGLAEQIVTLAVLAVATAMAVPAFHRMLERHELRTAQSDYLAALQHARNLAVNEQAGVILCPSRDAHTCSGDASWRQGWLVGRASGDDIGQILGGPRYSGRGYRDQLIITNNGNSRYVWFGPEGSAGNTWQSLFFCMKDDPQRTLKLTISKSGRIRGDVERDPAKSPCSIPN
jgi:type IV fimbrial biogenesis protein FimT